MLTKQRMYITLKLYKNGKTVLDTNYKLKSRVLLATQREMWENGYIKVWYNHKNNYYNDAEFTSLDQLKELLSVFTEKQLVDNFTY